MPNNQKILEQIMMNMVAIPEGSFLMGANNGERDERPAHNVLIDSFYIRKYQEIQNEWCSDWYKEDYYYKSPISNPQGSKYGSYRMVRGGDWARTSYFLRISSRRSDSPHFKDSFVGFRVAMAKNEEDK